MKFSRSGSERPARLGAMCGFCVCLSWTAHGVAQSESPALAEALFQEGRALLERGEIAPACAKLAESYKLDPAAGTLLNLAYCHEREGKLATAWAEFRASLSRARRDEREERATFASDSIARLEPRLPHVVLQVETPSDGGLRIELDGTELGRAAWGTPMPVDPGAHVIRATAPGRKPHRAQVTLVEGQTMPVQIPVLTPESPLKAPQVEVRAAKEEQTAQIAVSDASAPTSTRRTTAYALGGLGVLSLAAGSVFGVVAIQQKQESDEDCDATGCGREAHEKYETAQRNAMLSNVGLGVGVLGLGVGVYLYLTEPAVNESRSSARGVSWALVPVVDAAGAGMIARSRF